MKIRDCFFIIALIAVALLMAGCIQAPQSGPVTPTQTAPPATPPITTPVTVGSALAPANITTSKDLIAFVRQAVNYARENGKDKAIAAFNNPKGPFVTGNLYVFAES